MTKAEAEAFLDSSSAPVEKQSGRMSAEEAAAFLDKPKDNVISYVAKEVAATPRVVGSTLAGLVAWPIQKSYGIMTLATGGTAEEAYASEEFVASKIPKFLQPKSGAENAAINKLGAAMEVALKPATMAGEASTKNWGKRAGYITTLVSELLMFKGLHKAGTAGKINLKTKKASEQVLKKKLQALTPDERFYIKELVKEHKIKPFKPKKKDREEIERKMQESDPEKQNVETTLIKEAFEQEFLDKKVVEKVKEKVEKKIEKKKLKKEEKKVVKEKIEEEVKPEVEKREVVTKPTKSSDIKLKKEDVKQKPKEVKYSYNQLDTPTIRMLGGNTYTGTPLTKAWSLSKHTEKMRNEVRASFEVAKEKARKAGEVLKVEEAKSGDVVKRYTKGFNVKGKKTKDSGYVSMDVIGERKTTYTNVKGEKVTTTIAERIIDAKKQRIVKQGKKAEKPVVVKDPTKGLREKTPQDTEVFRKLVPIDTNKKSKTFGKEITRNNIAIKVVKRIKNTSMLAKDFSYDILNNVARDAIWKYVRKLDPTDVDAFLNGKVTSKIKGTAYKAAEGAVKNHIKKQLGVKQGKTRHRVDKELKNQTFREAKEYKEDGGRSGSIEEGAEAPSSGKSVRDKYLGKKQTDEAAYKEVKDTASKPKTLTKEEYLKAKSKEAAAEATVRDKTQAEYKKSSEKFKTHRPTKASKKGKTTRAERKREQLAIQAATKASIGAGSKAITKKKVKKVKEHPVTTEGGTTLYSGFPLHKAVEAYIKHTKGNTWEHLAERVFPKVMDKIPLIGKPINRALLYKYRGTMKKTKKFMNSMEDMQRHQAVGREYAINLGNRLQALPEAAQLKVAQSIKGKMPENMSKLEKALVTEVRDTFIALGKQATDLGLLNKKTFFKNVGKYMPRLYTRMEYKKLIKRYGEQAPDTLGLDRFQSRLDLTKERRKALGEILTPGYPVAKGIIQLTHDIEMGKFFSEISKNKNWTFNPKSKKAIPKGFRKLPMNKRLGKLSGQRVHAEIYEDITAVIREQSKGERTRAKMLAAWKFGKVVLSPKTHARNMMSNAILAHLGGMPLYEQPYFLYRAAQEMRGKKSYWVAASKEGLMKSTFTHAELKSMFRDVEIQLKGAKAGSMAEKMGTIGNLWEKGKQGASWAAKKYEAEEQWFKVAKFIHNVERRKMPFKEAAIDAEKWLFNYSKVTKAQHKYRTKWYGAPFATFTMKAMPRIAEAAVTTPHRFLLPAAMIYGLEQAAMEFVGDTPEQYEGKKEHRPDFMKGGLTKYLPSFPRVPFIDDDGREHYLSLSYILPWGDIAESGGFAGVIPGGISPLGMPMVSELAQQATTRGYDFFMQRDIVPETELAGKSTMGKIKTHAKYRAAHLAKTALPTPIIGAAKIYQAGKGKVNARGKERAASLVLLDELLGLKVYPVDYVDQMVRTVGKIHPKKGMLAGRIKRQIKTMHIKRSALKKKGRSYKYIDEQIEGKIKQLKGLAKEVSEKGKSFSKIKGDK